MKKSIILISILISHCAFAQDLPYARKTLSTLTSPLLWGRGYTNNGMGKAADFIEKEFTKMGLKPVQQIFNFPVNSFPGEMSLTLNGKKLDPGADFIVHQGSRGMKGDGVLKQLDSSLFVANTLKILLQPKLTWSVATKTEDFTAVLVRKGAIEQAPRNFKINIENQFIPDFKAANVYAAVKGTRQPDSVIVITAHYDHLGGMGERIYFPGANDNASGVSLLLNLAKFYAKNPPPYTVAFICFGAEEAGLIGSKYFTDNPLLSLSQIRFLINLDLVGTGEAGATVVNATTFPREFSLLTQINEQGKFLVILNPRGKAANSDHYFFSEKGVPAFFLYTQGGISAYHDIYDKAETLPLTSYESLFKLITSFNAALMQN